MDRLAAIADKQDCIELVYRMARAIDRRDPQLLESLFHPDATDDHGMFQGTAKEFSSFVMPLLDTMDRTQHVIGQVLIELAGDKAFGESYFVAHHTIPNAESGTFMIAAGRYLDRFERRDGEWKVAHRHAVYDWSSSAPASDIWDRANPGAWAYGVHGKDDASYAHFAMAANGG